MFFFIGGIQPKTVDIGSETHLCPSCGLLRAKYKRVDHYLSLFFIPVIPVKKGEPFLYCDKCGVNPQDYIKSSEALGSRTCRHCGRDLEQDFKYCPFCGKLL